MEPTKQPKLNKLQKKDKQRVRYKEYQCMFPGCTEGLKTKYNCISHIWDIHLRYLNGSKESFKTIDNKEEVKQLCAPYLKYVVNAEMERKRRPYDLGDLTNGEGMDQTLISPPESINPPQQFIINSNITPPQSVSPQTLSGLSNGFITNQSPNQTSQTEQISQQQNNILNDNTGLMTVYTTNQLGSDEINYVLTPEMQQQIQTIQTVSQCPNQQIQQIPQQISLSPIAYQLLANNEEFIRVYMINQSIKRLHVAGEVFAENGFLQRSDRRSKKDIKKISDALNTVLLISGKSFRYLNDDKVRFGFIAQELKEVIPEAVREDEDGSLSIDPLALLPFIVESLKQLSSHLDSLEHKTFSTKQFSKNVSNTLSVIDEVQKEEKIISLGPSSFVFPTAVFFTIITFVVSFDGRFPFIWGYLALLASCYWLSCKLVPKGVWNNVSISLNFALINVGLVSIAVTFLMGSALQIFLGVYICLMLFVWGGSQTMKTSFVNFFIVSFALSCMVCWIVFIFQPTFKPTVTTLMQRNPEFPEYVQFTDPKQVQFQLSSEVPWNCFDPHLVAHGRRMQFKRGDTPLITYAENAEETRGDRVQVKLSCSSVEYRCDEFNIAQDHQNVCIFIEDTEQDSPTTN